LDTCNAAKIRNRGWKKVTGDRIVFLDVDDYYHLDKLLITYNLIIKNPDFDCILHSYSYCNYINTEKRCSSFNVSDVNDLFNSTFPEGKFENRVGSNIAITHPVTHGISTCRASGTIRFNENFDAGEDGDFCQKHLFCKKLLVIDAVLMDYRKFNNSC